MIGLRQSQKGFTLLEGVLVLGVAAILLIGSVYGYRMVTEGNKATQSSRLLMALYQQALIFSHSQENMYTGIAYDSNAAAGAANGGNSPFVNGNILSVGERNPFNGRITIAPAASNGNLVIAFENISQQGCMRLLPLINKQGELVSVGTQTQTYTSAANQIPVSVANTSAACDQSVNTITWTFP